MKKLFICLLFLSASSSTWAQKDSLVQLSGLIMTSDSLRGIGYVNVFSSTNFLGTVSDYRGYFSLVVKKGDILKFSFVGYTEAEYKVPEDLEGAKYSIIQLMTTDTVFLEETIIYPWPTKEEFKEAFLSYSIPDDDLERARKNIEREKLRAAGKTLPPDGDEASDLVMRDFASTYYYIGQARPMPIFNVFAWKDFIEAWKRGDFKNKD